MRTNGNESPMRGRHDDQGPREDHKLSTAELIAWAQSDVLAAEKDLKRAKAQYKKAEEKAERVAAKEVCSLPSHPIPSHPIPSHPTPSDLI